VLAKLSVRSRAEAVRMAYEQRLISPHHAGTSVAGSR